jgi:nucleotide-binding universal stress UspA family protein
VSLLTAADTMHVPSHALAPAATRAAVAAEVTRINNERRARARKDLASASKTLTAAGWKVSTVVTEGAPLRDVLATVASTRADLLVVGARGVTGVRHLLLGSVAEGALNRSHVPVFVVR